MASLKPFLKQRNIFRSKPNVKGDLSQLDEDVERYFSLVHVWKIADVSKKLSPEVVSCESETFSCTGYPFKAKAQLFSKPEDDDLHISLLFSTTSALRYVTREVGVTIAPRVTYVVKDLSKPDVEAEAEDVFRSHDQLYRQPLRYFRSECEVPLTSRGALLLLSREDSLVIEVHVEPPALSRRLFSNEGSVTWSVGRYEHRKRMAERGLRHFLPSPYFYTHPKGCRAHVEMHLDGYGEVRGQRLCAVVRYLTGSFDYYVESYVEQTVVFVLFNQDDPNLNIVKVFQGKVNRKEEHVIDVVDKREIREGNFLKNDVLVYKVIIRDKGGEAINKIMYNVMAQP